VSIFAEIGQTESKIWRFFYFPRWQPSVILDLLCEWLDHPRRSFGGLDHCAKFGWNRCGSFDNMHVLVLWLWLENAYSRPFLGGFWGTVPQKMSLIVLIPKRTVLGWNHVIWSIKREYRPRGSSWALLWENKKDRTGKKVTRVIFHQFGEKPPLKQSASKLCNRWPPRRNHVCQVSKWNF